MKKHRIPIGVIIEESGVKIIRNIVVIIIFGIVLLKFSLNQTFIIKLLVLILIILTILYCIYSYRKTHILTSDEKLYRQNIIWHEITQKEIIFIKTYYLAKNKILNTQFILVSALILIIEVLLLIGFPSINHLDTVMLVTTIILLISYIIFQLYIKTWLNIDSSAECAYIPIYRKYHIEHSQWKKNNTTYSFYVSIILDGKKYIYKVENPEYCCNFIMIVNYKGLSCAINSKVLPC